MCHVWQIFPHKELDRFQAQCPSAEMKNKRIRPVSPFQHARLVRPANQPVPADPSVVPEPGTNAAVEPAKPLQKVTLQVAPAFRIGKRIIMRRTSPVYGIGCVFIVFRRRLSINVHLFNWMITLS